MNRGRWGKADALIILTIVSCYPSIKLCLHYIENLKPLLLDIATMFKRKNSFYFFHIFCVFKFFDCLTALLLPLGKAVIICRPCEKHCYCLIVGNFYSNYAMFIVVVCYTGIFNYPSKNLAIQRLLK